MLNWNIYCKINQCVFDSYKFNILEQHYIYLNILRCNGI